MINQLLLDHLPKINSLFRKHKVKKGYAFGSVCTPSFSNTSDVDLLIDFEENLDPLEEGESWWILYYELEKILNRPIDLVTEKSLRNPYLIEEINEKRELIYG